MIDRTGELCGLLARIKARTAETKATGIELNRMKNSVLDSGEVGIDKARWGAVGGGKTSEDDYMKRLRDRRMLA